MTDGIAIVGIGCRYPDARTPEELWHNALTGRRAFRRIPEGRLRVADYAPRSDRDPDSAYAAHAGLIEDFEIDRERFKIAGATFRATDVAHWLALDVAAFAIQDASAGDPSWLPRATTGVLVGNTLTGEMSRASALRLRWPYMARVMSAALAAEGIDVDHRGPILERAEVLFKQPLTASGEDSLAGGLSNTIAGRICNAFDLGGGGFTVDGACSSSLLAVAQACSALIAGDLDVAIAGGVDVSLDPFELVGFSRLGALARAEMRVYDADPTGFIPGEGAGFVVLMRHADALAQGRRVHAVVRGWGIASDGHGGITRPRQEGHEAALARCYARAGYGIETVSLFEGHGTGTAVGDETELAALARALRAGGAARPAAIGSIKAQIGHTKAAAGIAGLLKATAAVHNRILPPTIGVRTPAPELARADTALRIVASPEPWPADAPARAGVSAIGFGGINVHVSVESIAPQRRPASVALRRYEATPQDVELFVLAADSPASLAAQAAALAERVMGASLAELTDLAAALARRSAIGADGWRAAVVAATPDEARRGLTEVRRSTETRQELIDPARGWFACRVRTSPRIAFLFTGQSAPVPVDGGALCRRFPSAAHVFGMVPARVGTDLVDTRNAQPSIVGASLAAASVLESRGLVADVSIGHSLGELAALTWAGCWSFADGIAIAAARGRAMTAGCSAAGAMLGLSAPLRVVSELVAGTEAVVAAYNAHNQTVVAGPVAAIDEVASRASGRGVAATKLATSHPFHSPLMRGAEPLLRAELARAQPAAPSRTVISTITAAPHDASSPIADLLLRQLTSPVRFVEAMRAVGDVDLFVEVGPGRVLADLAASHRSVPAIAVDSCGASLRGMLCALGGAWALGAPIAIDEMFADRWHKDIDLTRGPRLFSNPCESAPLTDGTRAERPAQPPAAVSDETLEPPASTVGPADLLVVVRRELAETTELPLDAIDDDARLLEDLHLSSITIAQVVARVARALGTRAPNPLNGWARATVAQVAAAFAELDSTRCAPRTTPPPAASWVRAFAVVDEPCAAPAPPRSDRSAWRWHGGTPVDREPYARAIRRGAGAVAIVTGTDRDDLAALLAAARDGEDPLVILDPMRVAGGFARTVHLETGRPVCAVSYERLDREVILAAVEAEAAGIAAGFRAVHVDAGGALSAPVLDVVPLHAPVSSVGLEDVVLVTGGGRGIAAECALALAERTGCRLVCLGRSSPRDDAALEANLRRFEARGVRVTYVAADVTNAEAVHTAIASAVAEVGPITCVVHAAAVNEPRSLSALDVEQIWRTITPKTQGLANVLAAVDRSRLRHLIAFGSVIARSGLAGEAHYALANDALRARVARLQTEMPDCRCVVLEWSAWAEVGMAERIGRLDALVERGLAPIPVDQGVEMFLRAFDHEGALVIAGRLGEAGIVAHRSRDLPLLRFVERPVFQVPGVELICDVELTPTVDLYLDDHVLEGARVLPAVMQVEAACEALTALGCQPEIWCVEAIEFERAIICDDAGLTLRVTACVHDGGIADVVLTTSADAHAREHMRARFAPRRDAFDRREPVVAGEALVPPYGSLLPQRGRFERISRYRTIATKHCRFDASTRASTAWFVPHVASDLVLADPGTRDAALHGIQVAIPHQRVVPISARGVRLASTWPAESVVIEGRELSCDRDTYVWELVIRDQQGNVIEQWDDVRFRSLGARAEVPQSSFEPWVERRLSELMPGVWRTTRAIEHRRPDGRPDGAPDEHISASSAAELRLVVASHERVACDLELVVSRPRPVWCDLLRESSSIALSRATRAQESFDHAATRVWSALECCAKIGLANPQLTLVREDGDVLYLRAGELEIVTFSGSFAGCGSLVVAVATGRRADTVTLDVAS